MPTAEVRCAARPPRAPRRAPGAAHPAARRRALPRRRATGRARRPLNRGHRSPTRGEDDAAAHVEPRPRRRAHVELEEAPEREPAEPAGAERALRRRALGRDARVAGYGRAPGAIPFRELFYLREPLRCRGLEVREMRVLGLSRVAHARDSPELEGSLGNRASELQRRAARRRRPGRRASPRAKSSVERRSRLRGPDARARSRSAALRAGSPRGVGPLRRRDRGAQGTGCRETPRASRRPRRGASRARGRAASPNRAGRLRTRGGAPRRRRARARR